MWLNALYRSPYGAIYHIGVGSDVVCSTFVGSWKSLSSWNGQQDDSTLFCVKCNTPSLWLSAITIWKHTLPHQM